MLLALTLIAANASAEDPPLPAEAIKVLKDLDAAIAKLKAKAAADLQKVQDKETKAGSLETALAVKKAIEGLREPVSPAKEAGFSSEKEVMALIKMRPNWKFANGRTAVFDSKQMQATFLEGGKPPYTSPIRAEKTILWMGTCRFDFSKSDGKTVTFFWPGGESETVTAVEEESK
jgi:hypothetical protein